MVVGVESGTYQYHAINIKDKRALPEINPDMFAWLHHPHRRKELSFNLAERRACRDVSTYSSFVLLDGRSQGVIYMANAPVSNMSYSINKSMHT